MSDPSPMVWRNTRVKTPTLIQMEALECGAAALGIVLGYYGLFRPLETLRQDCGVGRDGSKALNIVKAARAYGMEAKGFRKEPEGLHTLKLPLILFWNFNHFVVLEGIRGKKVFINDPAGGPKTITLDELDQAFTGVALSITPGPEFTPGGKKPGMFRALGNRFPGIREGMAFGVFVGLALVIPGLVIPTFTRVFVDEILVANKLSWFKPLLLGMGVTLVLQWLLTWLQEHVLLRQQVQLAVQSSAGFFRHVLRLPFAFFAQRYSGEIAGRTVLNDRVAQLLSGELAQAALGTLTLVFFAALMLGYHPGMAALVVAMGGVNFFFLTWVSRKRSDLSQRVAQEHGKLMGTAMNGVALVETLKATGSESDFFSRWSGFQAKLANAQQEMLRWGHLVGAVPPLLTGLNTALILGVGALAVMEGEMTMGMLVAFQGLMNSFMQPLERLVGLGTRFQDALADMNRLDDVLAYPEDPIYQAQDRDTAVLGHRVQLTGKISLVGVHFGFNRLDPPLIRDLDMTLIPGSRVALVGASGSGKSTVAKLICGLHRPGAGEIRFDDRPMDEIPGLVMRNSLAHVDQDIFLLQGSVRENLTMWNRAVPERDMIRAAKDACIHEEITARAQGYDGPVAEGGTNFSGGQRQRLEIARALVTQPTILILDEATSALDPETEKQIDRNLRRRGCTCLIVAHRLSTIRDCDEIIVMDRGQVVQRGIHDELIREPGPYLRLIES